MPTFCTPFDLESINSLREHYGMPILCEADKRCPKCGKVLDLFRWIQSKYCEPCARKHYNNIATAFYLRQIRNEWDLEKIERDLKRVKERKAWKNNFYRYLDTLGCPNCERTRVMEIGLWPLGLFGYTTGHTHKISKEHDTKPIMCAEDAELYSWICQTID